ncbi:hypothetical protein [Aerococcus mictus]
MGKNLILQIVNKNTGSTLKQGDTTTLKYQLKDANDENLNIEGKPVQVALVQGNKVAYSTDTTVEKDNLVHFKIKDILPDGRYSVEMIVSYSNDELYIFPSDDQERLIITKSAVGLLNKLTTTKEFFLTALTRRVDELLASEEFVNKLALGGRGKPEKSEPAIIYSSTPPEDTSKIWVKDDIEMPVFDNYVGEAAVTKDWSHIIGFYVGDDLYQALPMLNELPTIGDKKPSLLINTTTAISIPTFEENALYAVYIRGIKFPAIFRNFRTGTYKNENYLYAYSDERIDFKFLQKNYVTIPGLSTPSWPLYFFVHF